MAEDITVQYRNGLYLPELDLWLDPHRGENRAFVSHAHSDHFARHRWTLCSEATHALIRSRYGASAVAEVVTPAWQKPFEIEGHEIRLLPAGHILGSAMLHLTRKSDGASLLYTGDFKLRQGLSSETATLLPADTLILETTFGLPQFRFPATDKIITDILTFVQETLEDGGIPVLMGYSLGKAQEVLAALNQVQVPVMLHSSMVKLTQEYERLNHKFPAWQPFKSDDAAGHALIFPPSAARSLAVKKLKVARTAMLSGWAMTPGAKFRYQVDEVFPLSDHADYLELLDCVAKVRPRMVYTVHGYTAEFASDLRQRGYEAWSIIGDNQMELSLIDHTTLDIEPSSKAAESSVSATVEEPVKAHPPDSFAAWAMTCELVSAQSSRLKKQQILAEYLRQVAPEHLPRVVRWFSAQLDDPSQPSAPIQTGWATIRQALLSVSGIRESEYRVISRSQNDTGRTAYLVLQRVGSSASFESSTLTDVAHFFEELRAAKGPTHKAAVLKQALATQPPLEGSYIVRLLTGELRIGSREGLVEEALAKAFAQSQVEIREAAMICGDLGQAALLASRQQLHLAQPVLFVPIKVMLASPEETAEDIWQRLVPDAPTSSTVWLEDKYDGIRAQIHVGQGRLEIYTRDLKKITHQFPEIAAAGHTLDASVILDGEIVAYAENKKLTFHDLQRRLGRKDQGDLFVASDITVKYVVFDLLWRNGESLLHVPLHERRQHLEKLRLPPLWQRIDVITASSAEAVESAFHAARRAGNEGLIAKDHQSLYTPGRRGKTWLKLKKAFSTLDVVVVKAEQGHGKRSHVLSDYTFAVKDDTGKLRVIGKAYSGLTDAEIEELTHHFTEHTLSQRGSVRTVTPNVVLEIAFDSIQESKRHDSGLAMRFPRIKAIRRDKTLEDIDSLDYARKLAGLNL